jgi:mRNA interferase HigB
MHLLTLKALREAAKKFPQHEQELLALGSLVSKGYFKGPDNLRAVFSTLDNFKYLDKYYVINLGHNELRLVALIFFESQKFYVRHVFTHKEYDSFTAIHRRKRKNKWLLLTF